MSMNMPANVRRDLEDLAEKNGTNLTAEAIRSIRLRMRLEALLEDGINKLQVVGADGSVSWVVIL
jgi:hypothetical protein